jgi:AcrR family transcriptional regulator
MNVALLSQVCTVVLVTNSRPYRSQLRENQAERTRELIAVAARARFLEKGWAGTSVRSVAEGAGVSQATVYNAYGSKAGLATSLIDAAEGSADIPRVIAELAERAGDPAGQIAAFAGFDRRLYQHAGDVLRILAEGRRQHPELATAYGEGRRRGDMQRRRVFGSWPDAVWLPGVGVDRAIAIYGSLVSLEGFDIATGEYGWSPEEVEQWWARTLTTLLLRA